MKHFIFSIDRQSNPIKVDVLQELLPFEYKEQLETINLLYDMSFLIEYINNKKSLIPKQSRICRFCGKSYPEVKFNKVAHRVPELLGNKNLLSDFECDNCNSHFGKYESDLANFLGPTRALSEIKGKNGIPKYKSRDKTFSLSVNDKSKIDIKIDDDPEHHAFIDKNMIVFHSKSDPFIPLNVYKCLLKSAISFIDTAEVQKMKRSLEFLLDDNSVVDSKYINYFQVSRYFINGKIEDSPFMILYKKNKVFDKYPAPTYVFIFYLKNQIFQLFLPFYEADEYITNPDIDCIFFVFPPLLKNELVEKVGMPNVGYFDLSIHDVIKDYGQITAFKLEDHKFGLSK